MEQVAAFCIFLNCLCRNCVEPRSCTHQSQRAAMAFIRRAVDPVLARGLDRYVLVRSKVRARLGLRQNKPWWQRPDSAATGAQVSDRTDHGRRNACPSSMSCARQGHDFALPCSRMPGMREVRAAGASCAPSSNHVSCFWPMFPQLSIAINLTLVGVGVPMGFNAVVGSREKERAALRVGTDVAQQSSDEEHGALALINDRRRSRGLAALGILPSSMTPEQLESAAMADRAGLAPDSDPHELVEGVHADAAPAWETALMRKCSEMHKDTMKRYETINRGMTHRTAGSIHGDPDEVLAEARRQGLDI